MRAKIQFGACRWALGIFAISIGLLLSAQPSWAGVIHVPSEQPDIQAGIDAATEGDTVLVADGTYTGDGNRDIDFGGKSIVLKSENGSGSTVIDCQGSESDPHFGFYFHSGEDATAVVEGFTVQGGYSNTFIVDTASGESFSVGGGVFCVDYSSPTLKNCIVKENRAGGFGGGIACGHGASPLLIGCVFIGNHADVEGGGIFCADFSSPTLTDCVFTENSALNGGGIYCTLYSSPTLTNCTFNGNSAGEYGGAICLIDSDPILEYCVFSGNPAMWGGGISCTDNASPTLSNCTFVGNYASDRASGIFCFYSSPTLENCIIAFGSGGGAFSCMGQENSPSLSCCDIYGNAGGDWADCIADQAGTNNNFSANPLFCHAAASDFHIDDDSPCAPANSPCGTLVGAYDVACTETSVFDDPVGPHPAQFTLWQNYPNPFNASTVIKFETKTSGRVTLDIYNILGERVFTREIESQEPGSHGITWNGLDNVRKAVPSGIYFYRVQADGVSQSRKMVLLK